MISLNDERVKPYLTPYKYSNPVLTGSGIPGAFDERSVDVPFVFLHNNQFYMLYTGFDGKGYQSALATSTDLLQWNHKGIILPREEDSERWDKIGGAATWIIKKSDNIYDTPELKKVDGRYWMVYHSYPCTGYEEGPAEIGLAWCEEEDLLHWHRLEEPVFSWRDGEAWERGGLYKACIISHNDTWYLFYNAKNREKRWIEQTGMAKSRDLLHWERFDKNPILKITPNAWDGRFLSDPYIVKNKDTWLNFYFGYDSGHAQEGLALSHNLEDWVKVEEPILAHGKKGDIDENHAHKASIVYYQDTLYHFYCATRPFKEGDSTQVYGEFRTIAVAADKPFDASKKEIQY